MAVSCLQLLARDAERDADKKSPLVPGSAAEYATSRLASAGVWTTWLRPTSPPHRDPPVPVDKTVAFLRQAASVNDLTVEQVIERLGEQEICRRARVPRRFVVQAVERLRSPRVSVYEAASATARPGRRVRIEGDPPTRDATVNRAYSALGDTYDFFLRAFGRDSLDGEGLPLVAVVHSGEAYNNAFWDGEQMIYGDGDGEVFQDFTIPMDVTAHELTHGVVQYTANLSFYGQPGALHESICDVFGSLVKQYSLGQTAGEADWLIGAGLFTPRVTGVALRSMKAPGTAYDDDVLGKDPQPATMDDYVRTDRDDGGIHINSGIPNHAFYLVATALGGHAWERAGQIWYDVLTGGELAERALFSDFAKLTMSAARARYGHGEELQAVDKAWEQVGVRML
ncbi:MULTISPECIES: M4 family metallopeptidase [Streptomyces]|uniref:Neutral metalloproteinase n=1 Tax=Streptomyces dengpaensis TaxID=2049881 RepID=A0ABN5ICK8_9ACTN|nr:M4 family peptidase [Streptomyces dengpaensis]